VIFRAFNCKFNYEDLFWSQLPPRFNKFLNPLAKKNHFISQLRYAAGAIQKYVSNSTKMKEAINALIDLSKWITRMARVLSLLIC
jgi:uncharacterized protein VirK/YbjX